MTGVVKCRSRRGARPYSYGGSTCHPGSLQGGFKETNGKVIHLYFECGCIACAVASRRRDYAQQSQTNDFEIDTKLIRKNDWLYSFKCARQHLRLQQIDDLSTQNAEFDARTLSPAATQIILHVFWLHCKGKLVWGDSVDCSLSNSKIHCDTKFGMRDFPYYSKIDWIYLVFGVNLMN